MWRRPHRSCAGNFPVWGRDKQGLRACGGATLLIAAGAAASASRSRARGGRRAAPPPAAPASQSSVLSFPDLAFFICPKQAFSLRQNSAQRSAPVRRPAPHSPIYRRWGTVDPRIALRHHQGTVPLLAAELAADRSGEKMLDGVPHRCACTMATSTLLKNIMDLGPPCCEVKGLTQDGNTIFCECL
jgi:hypothetical protein